MSSGKKMSGTFSHSTPLLFSIASNRAKVSWLKFMSVGIDKV